MDLCPIKISNNQIPNRRWGSSGFVFSNNIYIFGGIVANSLLSDLWYLKTSSWKWVQLNLENQPESRWGHTFHRIGNIAILFGGRCGSKPQDMRDIYWLELTKISKIGWKFTKIKNEERPKKRYGHASIETENSIIIFGGHGGRARFYNDVWELTLQDNIIFSWKEIKTSGVLPEKRSLSSGLFYQKKLYIVGGTDNNITFSDICILDWDTKIWSKININILHLQGHVIKMIPNTANFLIFGGVCNERKGFLLENDDIKFNKQYIGFNTKTAEVFDIPKTQPLSCCRNLHNLFVLDEKLICIFGKTTEHCGTNAVIQLKFHDNNHLPKTLEEAIQEICRLKIHIEQITQTVNNIKKKIDLQ